MIKTNKIISTDVIKEAIEVKGKFEKCICVQVIWLKIMQPFWWVWFLISWNSQLFWLRRRNVGFARRLLSSGRRCHSNEASLFPLGSYNIIILHLVRHTMTKLNVQIEHNAAASETQLFLLYSSYCFICCGQMVRGFRNSSSGIIYLYCVTIFFTVSTKQFTMFYTIPVLSYIFTLIALMFIFFSQIKVTKYNRQF